MRLRDDPELRAGIVTAAGERIFSAGWDIKAAHSGAEVGKWWELEAERLAEPRTVSIWPASHIAERAG